MRIYEIGDNSFEIQTVNLKPVSSKIKRSGEDQIEVEFEYRDFSEIDPPIKFIRKFHHITSEGIANKIINDEEVDISFCYVKDLKLNKLSEACKNSVELPLFYARYAYFDGYADFEYVDFGNLDFTGAIGEIIRFTCCEFKDISRLKFEFLEKLLIHECTIDKILELMGAKVLSLKKTSCLGYIYSDWDENNIQKSIIDNEDDFEEKSRQFSLMKQAYHKIGSYENEDKAFASYMRCKRKSKKMAILRFMDWLIDLIGVYGTKPARVAFTMFLVWLAFSFLFIFLDSVSGIFLHELSANWLNALYFSAVTFFTIGYGDIVPVLIAGKVLAPIEGMLGLFLMSYFTVSVVRRTLR